MDLSVRAQKELLVCYDVGNLGKLSGRRAAAILNVSLPTLKALLKNREAIEGHRAAKRSEPFRFDVETGPAERHGPTRAPEPAASDRTEAPKNRGTERTFRKRFENGDDARAGPVASGSVPATDGPPRRARDRPENALFGYDADDVYGLVETGLYREAPRGSSTFRGERLTRVLSVLFVTNVTGTDKKRPLVLTDRGRDPQLVVGDAESKSNGRWLAGGYAAFLERWDADVWPRKVLLIHDNRSVCPTVALRNIEIRFLPKSAVHPLGLGIARVARTCEDYEKRARPRSAGAPSDHGRCDRRCDIVTVSEALDTLVDAWEMVSPALVRNCFRAIGLVRTKAENDRVGPNLEHWLDRRRRTHRFSGAGSLQFHNGNRPSPPFTGDFRYEEPVFDGCHAKRTLTETTASLR